jgi:putative ABC transport system substrate-binding protein
MNKISRRSFLAVSAAAAVTGVLAGCGSAAKSSAASSAAASTAASSAAASSAAASGGAVSYKVGICQLVQHNALDAATKGFREKLTELVTADGSTVDFDEQNASGDVPTCTTICTGFVSANVDLIMANATPALQAAAAATSTIPVLGTSVTTYGVALDIDNFSGVVGTNVSGTSDLAPLDEQATMLTELFPDAKKVGLLFCSAEANSQYQVDTVQGYLEKAGLTCTQYSFNDTNDVNSVTQTACNDSDVIYIPTDNTAAANTEAINNVCLPAKVPVIAGEEGICKGCGVATLSISYYDLGAKTGEMAYDVLCKGADISKMEIAYAPKFTKEYNATNAEALGVTIPSDYVAIAD